ncbi:MAG: 7-cyano-7-deazaguanine synthase [Armatimonadetes bacterium]|nr:7-cyano-7-deazaguanine synthase [Armatimonadota bacterium]
MARAVRLLWTGGWDSTFQLLRLLNLDQVQVEPIYIIDEERRSVGVEILVMKRIKERLFNQYPASREFLLPTRYHAVADISPNGEITNAYLRLKDSYALGSQYEWLARFCEEKGLRGVQICVGHQPSGVYDCLSQVVEGVDTGLEGGFRVSDRFRTGDQYKVFRHYTLPIFGLSKLDTARVAAENGWDAIMRMTWFCHHPRKGMRPCGTCNPCLAAIDEGFGWRLPASSRVRSILYRGFFRPAKAVARKVVRRSQQ